MTGDTIASNPVSKPTLVSEGLAMIDLGYQLSVTTGAKGNQPYLPEWQIHPIPASHWREFVGPHRFPWFGEASQQDWP